MGYTARAQAQPLRALSARKPSSRRKVAVSAELRAGTLRLTVVALGLVLGLSSAAVLPLLLPWHGQAALVAISMLLALLPFAGVTLVLAA